MYGHGNYNGTSGTNTNEVSYNLNADVLTQFSIPEGIVSTMPPSTLQSTTCFLPPPLVIPTYNELDALELEFGNTTSNGCSSYDSPSSYMSYNEAHSLMQGNMSSHSLIEKKANKSFQQLISPTTNEHSDSDGSSVRRVYSVSDLQGVNIGQHSHRSESSLSNESSSSIIESMSKANRYSPEEKKEKIERYRNKKNQRNFNKKIKYECRKTLADSRPRIRGRFARNDEIEKVTQNPLNNQGDEEYYGEEEDTWISLLDSFSANLIP